MLIGIAGGKRVGKTTLANMLAEKYQLRHVSFAAPIREFTAHLLGATLDQLEAEKETPIAWLDGITPRRIMQTLGTECGREMWHPDVWVRVAMRKAVASGRAVISDVRFPNEAEAIRGHGGCILRLSRATSHTVDAHESERPLPPECVDFDLANDGTVPEMLARAESLLFGPEGMPSIWHISTLRKLARLDSGSPDAAVEALLPPGSAPGED